MQTSVDVVGNTPADPSASEAESFAKVKQDTRNRILHTLTIYPFISSSMIHIGIGSSNSVHLWKPILQELIQEGVVKVTNITAESPLERTQSYQIYHLSINDYVHQGATIPAGD